MREWEQTATAIPDELKQLLQANKTLNKPLLEIEKKLDDWMNLCSPRKRNLKV
jgi:hypothetical protein